MKILHVSQGYFPSIGGTEWLVQRLSEELVHQFNDDVTVFTTNCYNGEGFFNPRVTRFPVGLEMINGVKVRRFPVNTRVSQLLWKPQQIAYLYNLPYNQYLRTWGQGPLIPGLRKAIVEFNPDVIVATSFPLMHMYVALRAAQEIGRPCIYMGALHPDDQWGFGRSIIYKAIQQATEYIAYTEFEAEHVVQKGADSSRVHVIGMGVDPDLYKQISRTEARWHYGLEKGPVVGFIGQVAGHKVEMLLHAMPIVWQQIPQAQLLIAGSKTNYDERLKSIVSTWPPEYHKRFKLIYNFDEKEKPWLFACTDVFVYASAWESFGITYLEAWAAKKPVIGSFRGAVPWVVDAGRDGLLVHFQNNEMLAEAIILLLKKPDLARQMGEAGWKKVVAKHTWSYIGQRFRQVYEIARDHQRASES
jgi:glycosyltransferase involved in cell wall biosynthesis